MKQEITVSLIYESNGSNCVSFAVNGRLITNIKEFNLEYKEEKILFNGKRFKQDRSGQCFIDENKETASEDISYLNYLSPRFDILEITSNARRVIDFGLKNIRDTSFLNAKNYMKERGHEYS